MSYLIEILLPIADDMRRSELDLVRSELTERFGGVTLHVNAPAEGLWDDDGCVEQDKIVIVEVMADYLDRQWWADYRKTLEARLRQEEIAVRAIQIEWLQKNRIVLAARNFDQLQVLLESHSRNCDRISPWLRKKPSTTSFSILSRTSTLRKNKS